MSVTNHIRRMLPYSPFRGWGGVCGSVFLFLLFLLTSCNFGRDKQLNQRVTLWRKDKIPYGTYVAYENLSYIFPNADISINKNSPSSLAWGGEDKKAYIIITPHMDPDSSEVNAIMSFVGGGNHVFMSAFQFGDSLLHTLNIRPAQTLSLLRVEEEDSLRLSVYSPVSYDSLPFVYPGATYDTWIDSLDSRYATILGRDAKGRPDFVKFNYKGGGSLYLHFAPMAFTNFFLLHKDNMAYYENVLSYLPVSVKEVIWDEYFRYDRRRNFSALQYILGNRSLRWAFWLLLGLFGLIYLFESKRKQRMIPVISGLRNSSLDFVRTIGRLYYQRRDNYNLAVKLSTHFQDHIRTKYNLNVSITDPVFVDRLSYKTGLPKETLAHLVSDVLRLQEEIYAMTDWELLELNRRMEEFYKTA